MSDARDPRDGSQHRTSFWAELKRRHVYKVAVVYAAVAVAVWQVADIIVPVLGLPDWIMKLVVIGPIITFPFAIVLAWAYDITPDGIRATPRAAEPTGSGAAGRSANTAATGDIIIAFSARAMRRAVLGILALIVVVGGGWWAAGSRWAAQEPGLSEVSLAVFPFTVRGSERLEYLREGVVDLLSRNLSGASELQPLDPSLMLTVTGGVEPGDPRVAGGIARRLGAGRFVTGTVNGTGSRIRIDASLFAVRDSVHLVATRTVQGDTTQLFDLIDELTAGLLSELTTGAASERMVRTAASTTSSLPALKAYLEGEQRYRQGEHRDAAAAFQRALEADSAFALARYRLAMTHHMRGQFDAARREVDGALRHTDRLTAHDQRVMNAFRALHAGSIDMAEQQLRAIVREYPRDLEARVILGELLMWYAPARAAPLAEARRLFEEVLEADPKFMCIFCQLAAVLAAEGDIDGSDRLMRQLNGRDGGDTTTMDMYSRFRSGVIRGDSVMMWTAMAEFDTVPDARYGHMVGHAGSDAMAHGRFREVEAIIAALAGRPQARREQLILQALLSMARGEWQAAGPRLASLRRLPDPGSLDWLAGVHLFFSPFEMRIDQVDDLRDRLLAAHERPASVSSRDADLHPMLWQATRFYLLGLIASRQDQVSAARTYADSLVQLAAALPEYASTVDGLARVIRADLALRAGDPRTALRDLDAIDTNVPPSLLNPTSSGLWHAGALRARAYMAVDDSDRAYRWLRYSVGAYGSPMPAQHGTYHRDIALVLDALGRGDEAATHYARFVDAWSGADAELQPQVEAARARLRVLAGEGGP
ncbi:hypothetical protein BH23GEM9_BH23GEM9_22360 [soil metagenome]